MLDVWNPETDPMLEKNYNIKTMAEGKSVNKEVLCKQFGFESGETTLYVYWPAGRRKGRRCIARHGVSGIENMA